MGLKMPLRTVKFVFVAANVVVLLFLLCTWAAPASTAVKQPLARYTPWKNAGERPQPSNRENATLVTLCRNSDLPGLLNTIQSWEDRFNRKYHYDWVFLNDEEFTQEFVNLTASLVSGTAKYGVITEDMWSYPSYIDQKKAAEDRGAMEADNILYGGSEPYRHMCRFQSGFFYRHPLMLDYKYYWRVDGDTEMYCDIDYDVFTRMREGNKRYGFVIAIYEFIKTIPTLWESTQEFVAAHPDYVVEDNLIDFISDDGGKTYNLCHFWSNFEIADGDFWREAAYDQYFDYLDKKGGFFYERWGDAPVHSLAAALFLKKSEVLFFDDIGYRHPPYSHVPHNFLERGLTCAMMPQDSFDWDGYSCMRQYYRAMGWEVPAK